MRIPVVFLATAVAAIAGQIEGPSIGYIRSAAGDILKVTGVSGAFITTVGGQPGAVSASFSARLSVIKLAASVQVLDSGGVLLDDSEAPIGAALAGFNPRGDSAILYYPGTRYAAVFAAGVWRDVPAIADVGTVLAVALPDAEHALVLTGGDQYLLVRLRLTDGAIEDSQILLDLPPNLDSVLLFPEGDLLFLRDDTVVLRDSNGVERSAPGVSEAVVWSHLGEGWVHGRTESGRSLGVRLQPAIRIFELPEISQ